ncbi:MAG: HAMP domain-containing histidine kinase [Paenibacillaceae bacterium]|nr:HAMP domain-containing histidine kinase [Paenibacillaceae bacterium]
MFLRKRNSLLRHWSIRYFITLFSCMIVVGVVTSFLFQQAIERAQYRSMGRMVAEMAQAAEASGRWMQNGAELARWLDDLSARYELNERTVAFLWDGNGAVRQQFPPNAPLEAGQLAARKREIMTAKPHIIQLEAYGSRPPFLAAVHPLKENGGYVLLLMPKSNLLQGFIQFKIPRIILTLTVILTGWSVIYMLTRRLVKPIQEAAAAAKQVVAGNYSVKLDKEHQELEVYELMSAFKEMADRLQWLESLRTQLLAGVTHELKTPVASISGLIQAVKAGVVKGEEAEKFMAVCLKECQRLQKMVEDLLDFNRFAGNTVEVAAEPCNLLATIEEIVDRWRHGQDRDCDRIIVEAAADVESWRTLTDPNRLEQIIVNLLNNAKDATRPEDVIHVRLLSDTTRFRIQVTDPGHGIPANEQLDIFEPFYRGKQKKTKVRGLGLGLPFSRMIARSLDGDLVLTDSSPAGTTFTLLIPFDRSQVSS